MNKICMKIGNCKWSAITPRRTWKRKDNEHKYGFRSNEEVADKFEDLCLYYGKTQSQMFGMLVNQEYRSTINHFIDFTGVNDKKISEDY